jgi:hypothetical protein
MQIRVPSANWVGGTAVGVSVLLLMWSLIDIECRTEAGTFIVSYFSLAIGLPVLLTQPW